MIRNWDYLDDYVSEKEKLLEIINRVLSSGRLILGPEVEAFEKNFAGFCGMNFGVGVNSGTDAIFLALKALGIGQGDEVITVSFIPVPTVAAIRATGATPVFVDIEADTFLMDVIKLDTVYNEKVKAIVPVHLFGQAVDMDPLIEFATSRNLAVIEDCAQAAGALYRGRRVGSMGDIGAFSFYPTKILGAYGDAGMAVTDREDLYKKLKKLRFYGMDRLQYSEEEGYNSRMDELQAAILNFKLAGLDINAGKRRLIASYYSDGLKDAGDILLPEEKAECVHQYYAYTIQTEIRNELKEFLAAKEIEARINYGSPVHLMRAYDFLGYKKGALPVTEKVAGNVLSLPIYPALSKEAADRIIEDIRTFYKNK